MHRLARSALLLVVLAGGSLDCGDDHVDVSVRCQGADASGGGTACSAGSSECSDGHRYAIDCRDTSHSSYDCTCRIDDKMTKTISTSTFCDSAHPDQTTSIHACGFPLQ
jgi:hypothetical protein